MTLSNSNENIPNQFLQRQKPKTKQEILKTMLISRTPEDGLCSIYRISTDRKSYIGSTKMIVDMRYRCHVNAYNRYVSRNLGAYCASFDVLKDAEMHNEQPKFEILERMANENKAEREAYYISYFRGLTSVVNKNEANKNSIQCRSDYMRVWKFKKISCDGNREFRNLCKISI
jgi:hypothetical protein